MTDFTAHRHPVLAVPCPDCGAPVGAYCTRPSGHRASDFHTARKLDADRVWYEEEYPPVLRTPDGWAYGPLETAEERAEWQAARRDYLEEIQAANPQLSLAL